jgi:hypothetical protein
MVVFGSARLGAGSATTGSGGKTAAGSADRPVPAAFVAAAGGKTAAGQAGVSAGNLTHAGPARRRDTRQLAALGTG